MAGFFKSFNWITDRLDSVTGWYGKKKKRDYEKKIDRIIDGHDTVRFNDLMRKIEEKREARRNSV